MDFASACNVTIFTSTPFHSLLSIFTTSSSLLSCSLFSSCSMLNFFLLYTYSYASRSRLLVERIYLDVLVEIAHASWLYLSIHMNLFYPTHRIQTSILISCNVYFTILYCNSPICRSNSNMTFVTKFCSLKIS